MFSMPPATISDASPARIALVGEHDGFQARAADFVDRERADGLGQAGEDRRLSGRVLAQARADHITHDHFVESSSLRTAVRSRRALMQAHPDWGRNSG